MANNKNVVILCDWLPPEFGAVGQYAVGFARQLATEGYTVALVGLTSGDPSMQTEAVGDGVLTIMRVHRPMYDKSAWLDRAFWTLGANIKLIKAAWSVLRTCDEIRFTGSPPYMLHFIMPVALLLGKRTRYRITDFHPECLVAALGYTPFWLKPIRALTIFWRRRVDIIEVLGEDQRRRITECGVSTERIALVRDPSPVEFKPSMTVAVPPPLLSCRAIILYSGNWGVAHDVDTFINGFALFCARYPDAAGVWLNATGKRADLVEKSLAAHALPHVRSKPVALDQLPGVLAAADIHLITLNDAFVGYVLPSKVYACVESGRSVLFIGSIDSDVHLVCSEHLPPERYRRVDAGNPQGVLYALMELLALK